ncbi:Ig-like domain-containing protein [Buttiauxella agrestis]
MNLGNGKLGYNIPVNPRVFSNNKGEVDGTVNVHATITSHDDAGNAVIATQDHLVKIDNHANATLTIDAVTKDNILNHDELNAEKQFVHGNVGGDARVGDVVNLEIRGNHFTGSVVDFGNGNLGYNIEVDPRRLAATKAKLTVTSTSALPSNPTMARATWWCRPLTIQFILITTPMPLSQLIVSPKTMF